MSAEDIKDMGRETMCEIGLTRVEAKRLQRSVAPEVHAAPAVSAVPVTSTPPVVPTPEVQRHRNPSCDIEAQPSDGADTKLIAELEALNVKTLRARAAEAGVPAHEIEEARDGNDPKGDMISLILQRGPL